MHHLEMPEAFAGARIQRQQAIGEEIGPQAVRAVEIVLGAGGGRVENAAPRVQRHFAPNVGPADALPGILRPRLVPELPRMRNGVKRPDHLSTPHVEGANVPRRRSVALIRRRSQYQQVFKYPPRRGGLHQRKRPGVASQPRFQIDAAALAKRQYRLAGPRIDRPQEVVAGKQQAAVGAVLALPVVDPPVGDNPRVRTGRIRPHFLACPGVQRDDGVALSQHIHPLVDDDRIEGVLRAIPRRVNPGTLQSVHVRALNLPESGVLRGIGASRIVPPRQVLPGRGFLTGGGTGPEAGKDEGPHGRGFSISATLASSNSASTGLPSATLAPSIRAVFRNRPSNAPEMAMIPMPGTSFRKVRIVSIPSCSGITKSVITDRKSTRLNSSHRCISYAVF